MNNKAENRHPQPLGNLVCWTRMQAEAGQSLEQIIARKELERRAGAGYFCWGVGNAPAATTAAIARLQSPVSVVFSIMKGKPRPADLNPRDVLVWRKYIDFENVERDLPPHALVTSRGETRSANKSRHYALMCYTNKPLCIQRGEPFDPASYRNASGAGGMIGYSQVTALLRRTSEPTANTAYEKNLTAQLTGSYWVRLCDPSVLREHQLDALNNLADVSHERWIDLAMTVRKGPRSIIPNGRQGILL